MEDLERISADVLHAAFEIHKDFGLGLLESVYEIILSETLKEKGYKIECQKPIGIHYKNIHITSAFRADILVNSCFLIEIKSVDSLNAVHGKQLLTYLKLMNLPIGLLINFGGATIKGNVKRVVQGDHNFVSSRLRVNQLNEGIIA
jgi:GxxExxY protein